MSLLSVDLPIRDGPKWISHIEVSRDQDFPEQLCLRIVKHSGEDYGCVLIEDERLRQIMELLA